MTSAFRILIVDDSDFARSTLRKLIEDVAADCEVVDCMGSEEALETCAQSDPFDLILLDVYMPRMGGFDLAQLLRFKQDNAICVMVTAAAKPEVTDLASAVGLRLLPKPLSRLNAEELVNAVDPERRESNDALLEIFNVGIGASAAALSEMVSDEVVLNLPALSMSPASRAAQLVRADHSCGVSIEFSGTLGDGTMMLMFQNRQVQGLLRALVPDASPQELEEQRSGTLAEVGNVILNACLASLAGMLDAEFTLGLPKFIDSQQTGELVDHLSHSSAVMIQLDLRFGLRSSDVDGSLFLFVNAQQFREQIRVKLAS